MARQCFFIPVEQFDAQGWIPSMVTEGEPGHAPLTGNGPFAEPWHWGLTYEQATETCEKENLTTFGLTPEEADKIVASSMAARRPAGK